MIKEIQKSIVNVMVLGTIKVEIEVFKSMNVNMKIVEHN